MKRNRTGLKIFSVITALLFFNISFGQSKNIDKDYIESYPNETIVRIFLSQKFAPFTISSNNLQDLNYKTNSKLNLGAGVTYKNLTANLSYGFRFLNPDNGKGTTKGLDLQIHIFPQKWAVDILGAFLTGYYLDPKDNNGLNLTTYYQRPDIKRNIVGFSLFRVLNSDKFSYKAAVTQSEWQKKSAGSFLYGGQAYYGSVKGSSPFVPDNIAQNFSQSGVSSLHFESVGVGAGYAYTLVISNNYFISASAIATADVDFSSEDKNGQSSSRTTLTPGADIKTSIGYNSDVWSVSASVLGNAIYSGSAFTSKKYFFPTGNARVTVARRI